MAVLILLRTRNESIFSVFGHISLVLFFLLNCAFFVSSELLNYNMIHMTLGFNKCCDNDIALYYILRAQMLCDLNYAKLSAIVNYTQMWI